jgi:hypothetical protein
LVWKIKAVDQVVPHGSTFFGLNPAATVPQRQALGHLQKSTTLNLLANEDRENLNVGGAGVEP